MITLSRKEIVDLLVLVDLLSVDTDSSAKKMYGIYKLKNKLTKMRDEKDLS